MPRSTTVLRAALPLVFLGACLWMLADRLTPADIARVPQTIRHIPLHAIALSGIFTAISMWAVGRYDVVAHRHLGTGQSSCHARRAGTVAIALSQTLGFGLVTGALARWRMLPDLSPLDALRLSGFVSVSFMAGLSFVCAVSIVVLDGPAFAVWPALGILFLLPFFIILLFLRPVLGVARHTIRMPSLRATAAIIVWTGIDTLAAGIALYVLLPDVAPGFATFFPVFLLALGAGLITGTPGGVGPFELVLLTLLPQMPQAPLLAALVCYRGAYYACPAVLAMIAMTRPFPAQQAIAAPQLPSLDSAPRAEVGVIRQNGGHVLAYRGGAAAVWPQAQSLIALFDPVQGGARMLLPGLVHAARARNLLPCLYKAGAESAATARRAGWQVAHIADEAILSPLTFDLELPRRRSLRRKLRTAEKAGITITSPRFMPWCAMARVDVAWLAEHGAARGATIGRFCSAYLRSQQVFLAWQNGNLVAFISLHRADREWCLDLMRHDPAAPNGTMHALVCHAIESAHQAGVPTFSLAAVPACPDPDSARMRWLAGQVVRRAGGVGLRQFKSGFAPRWRPLYAAAPTRLGLVLALVEVVRGVLKPTRLPVETQAIPHNEDEYYEVASSRAA